MPQATGADECTFRDPELAESVDISDARTLGPNVRTTFIRAYIERIDDNGTQETSATGLVAGEVAAPTGGGAAHGRRGRGGSSRRWRADGRGECGERPELCRAQQQRTQRSHLRGPERSPRRGFVRADVAGQPAKRRTGKLAGDRLDQAPQAPRAGGRRLDRALRRRWRVRDGLLRRPLRRG